MIWVTGDKHGQGDWFDEPIPRKTLKRGDLLIVCGDFGFVWDGSQAEQKALKRLSRKKFTIAFLDGCHENFTLLARYPEQEWNGGKVRKIAENIFWLQRGESYQIDGKTFLVFGGGAADVQREGEPFSPEAGAVTEQQVNRVVQSIQKAGGAFDVILSHEAPRTIVPCLFDDVDVIDTIHDVLENIRTHTRFHDWFFGCYHVDKVIPPSYHAVFHELVPCTERRKGPKQK